MKRVFLLFFALLTFLGASNTMAQKTNTTKKEVTKFLGIPVDGTKNQMIQKLKAKGFTYNQKQDILKGKFNGRDVYISVVTNKNKVWRIMVEDAISSNETAIKIRFNELCRQFMENGKYVPQDLTGKYEIEDTYLRSSKRYQAVYFQVSDKDKEYIQKIQEGNQEIRDEIQNDLLDYLNQKYTQEQLDNLTEEEIQNETISFVLEMVFERIKHRSVWFMISDEILDYRIIMYYDNELNKANGEDL